MRHDDTGKRDNPSGSWGFKPSRKFESTGNILPFLWSKTKDVCFWNSTSQLEWRSMNIPNRWRSNHWFYALKNGLVKPLPHAAALWIVILIPFQGWVPNIPILWPQTSGVESVETHGWWYLLIWPHQKLAWINIGTWMKHIVVFLIKM